MVSHRVGPREFQYSQQFVEQLPAELGLDPGRSPPPKGVVGEPSNLPWGRALPWITGLGLRSRKTEGAGECTRKAYSCKTVPGVTLAPFTASQNAWLMELIPLRLGDAQADALPNSQRASRLG